MAEPTPVKVNRTLYRGDTRVWTHVFTDTTSGDPIDLTGYTFTSQIRGDLNRGTVIAEAVCEVTDPTGGVVVETLSATQADLLPGQEDPSTPTVVYGDLQSIDGDGNVQTWERFVIKILGDATDE